VVAVVAQSYGVPVSSIQHGGRGRENEPRKVAGSQADDAIFDPPVTKLRLL